MNKTSSKLFLFIFSIVTFSACGRRPADTFAQGQLSLYDFPLYLSDGGFGGTSDGVVYEISATGVKTQIISGLNQPQGIATDLYGKIYVVERGNNRLLRYEIEDPSTPEIVLENLQSPSVVAVDSVGEIFVTQDDAKNVLRVRDGSVWSAASEAVTALAFGVSDIPIFGFSSINKVFLEEEGTKASLDVTSPVNASIDGVGRIYIAEGISNGRILRFNQDGTELTEVASGVKAPQGIAVDAVGNVFIVEKGLSRISLATFDLEYYSFIENLIDPQYLSFTQY